MKKVYSITLDDLDRDIVREVEAMEGASFSAAIRKIVREWARSQGRLPQAAVSAIHAVADGEQIAA